jgi:hypothetical protein
MRLRLLKWRRAVLVSWQVLLAPICIARPSLCHVLIADNASSIVLCLVLLFLCIRLVLQHADKQLVKRLQDDIEQSMADKMEHDRQQALRAEADKVYTRQYYTYRCKYYCICLSYNASRTSTHHIDHIHEQSTSTVVLVKCDGIYMRKSQYRCHLPIA